MSNEYTSGMRSIRNGLTAVTVILILNYIPLMFLSPADPSTLWNILEPILLIANAFAVIFTFSGALALTQILPKENS